MMDKRFVGGYPDANALTHSTDTADHTGRSRTSSRSNIAPSVRYAATKPFPYPYVTIYQLHKFLESLDARPRPRENHVFLKTHNPQISHIKQTPSSTPLPPSRKGQDTRRSEFLAKDQTKPPTNPTIEIPHTPHVHAHASATCSEWKCP
jgi:hypothetical protein